MYLEGILSTGYTSQAAANSIYTKQEEEQSLLPRNWGNDTVNFSPEARAAQQRTQEAEQQAAEDKAEDDATSVAFAEYMQKARGEESSPASPEEELERLKEKLKKLTEQKAQVAKKEDPAGQAKMEALDAEINQVMSQMSELMTQIAKEKNGK